jgi:hypothetical protein
MCMEFSHVFKMARLVLSIVKGHPTFVPTFVFCSKQILFDFCYSFEHFTNLRFKNWSFFQFV